MQRFNFPGDFMWRGAVLWPVVWQGRRSDAVVFLFYPRRSGSVRVVTLSPGNTVFLPFSVLLSPPLCILYPVQTLLHKKIGSTENTGRVRSVSFFREICFESGFQGRKVEKNGYPGYKWLPGGHGISRDYGAKSVPTHHPTLRPKGVYMPCVCVRIRVYMAGPGYARARLGPGPGPPLSLPKQKNK